MAVRARDLVSPVVLVGLSFFLGCPRPAAPAPAAPSEPPPAEAAEAPAVDTPIAETAPATGAPAVVAPAGDELRRGQRVCPVCQASPRFPVACALCKATGLVRSEREGPEPTRTEFLAALAPRGRRGDYEALSAETDAQASWDRGDLAALAAWAHERLAAPVLTGDTMAGPDMHSFSGMLSNGLREGLWRRPAGPQGEAVESRYRAGVLHGVHFKGTGGYWEYVLGTEARSFATSGDKVVAGEELVCGIALPFRDGKPTREQLLRSLPWEWLGFPLCDLKTLGEPPADGLRSGPTWGVLWEDGGLAATGAFDWGTRHGPWSFTYPGGKTLAEGSYQHGRLVGVWTWSGPDEVVCFKARFNRRGVLEEVLEDAR